MKIIQTETEFVIGTIFDSYLEFKKYLDIYNFDDEYGFFYFFQLAENEFKIGYTQNPKKRMLSHMYNYELYQFGKREHIGKIFLSIPTTKFRQIEFLIKKRFDAKKEIINCSNDDIIRALKFFMSRI